MRDYESEKQDYPGQPGWSNAIRIFKNSDGNPYPTWVRVVQKIAQSDPVGSCGKRGHLSSFPEIVKRGMVPEELQEKVLAVHSRNKNLLEEIDSSNWEESKALYEEGKLESKKRKEEEYKNSFSYLKELGLQSVVNLEINGETFEIQINDSGEVECWTPYNMYMGSLSVNQVKKPDFNLNKTLERMLAEAFEGSE